MRAIACVVLVLGACGGTGNGGAAIDASGGSGDAGDSADARPLADATPPVPQYAELWYSVDDLLVYIPLDTATGAVDQFVSSTLTVAPPLGQDLITMLDDGSLLLGRLSQADDKTYFFHIAEPPRDGSPVTPTALGVMPDDLMLEGLYTDCDGRVYGMDTGVNDTSSEGNRLLRFTGDVLAGDFTYAVVSDLATADVADIDDMSPAIAAGEIRDNPGLAIDSGTVHAFDFETGSGTMVASGGTWGIHALGGGLFDDDTARLYLLSSDANLYEMNPVTYAVSPSLGTGPTPAQGNAGWSGLAGPLTECDSGFTVE